VDTTEAPGPPVRSRAWIGRAAFEASLIVLGLVGALIADEWRDTRERDARVRSVLASIRSELEADRKELAQAVANHEEAAITNDIDHAMLMALGRAYTTLADHIGQRERFLNYLYTNNVTDLRRNPLILRGWLRDILGHTRRVDEQFGNALRVLGTGE
jgi:hypothetical protein